MPVLITVTMTPIVQRVEIQAYTLFGSQDFNTSITTITAITITAITITTTTITITAIITIMITITTTTTTTTTTTIFLSKGWEARAPFQ